MEPAPLVVADDLTGAAECAMQWRLAGVPAVVHLGGHPPVQEYDGVAHRAQAAHHGRSAQYDGGPALPASANGAVHVIDTHTRQLGDAQAGEAITALFGGLPAGGTLLFKKIDSIWRGNIGAELRALRAAGYGLIVAGAMPDLGRSVLDGKPLVQGKPLAEAGLWEVEPRPAPKTIAELLEPLAVEHLDLAAVRSPSGPEGWLATLLAHADAVVVDGETEADLDAVARAAIALSHRLEGQPVALVGTGALARALARHTTAHNPQHAHDGQHVRDAQRDQDVPDPQNERDSLAGVERAPRPVLAVVGSANATAARQVADLREAGIPVFAPGDAGAAGEVLRDGGVAAIAVANPADAMTGDPADATTAAPDPTATNSARRDPAVVLHELAEAVHTALAAAPDADLVLTGGETARTLLDALGVRTLRPLRQLQHGVVASLADDGRLVAAKPGSFGTPESLTQATHLLRALRAAPIHQENA